MWQPNKGDCEPIRQGGREPKEGCGQSPKNVVPPPPIPWGGILFWVGAFAVAYIWDFGFGFGENKREAKVEAAKALAVEEARAKANEPLTEDELRDGGLKMFMDNREFFVLFVTMTKYGNQYDREQGFDLFEKWDRRQREEGNWNANSLSLFSIAEKHAIRDINSR